MYKNDDGDFWIGIGGGVCMPNASRLRGNPSLNDENVYQGYKKIKRKDVQKLQANKQ